jgi:hypothetical protein
MKIPFEQTDPETGRTIRGSLNVQPPMRMLGDVFREQHREAVQEAYLDALNAEAMAWDLWKKIWKPTLWDRIYLFLNRPAAAHKSRMDMSDLCRLRYRQHLAKR